MHPRLTPLALAAASVIAAPPHAHAETAPIEFGFLWHMHQPIYTPGSNILETDGSGRFSFSVTDVHNQRFGPYTSWPRNAVQSGSGQPNLGAQVSFSGSLIENLNTLEGAGVNGGMWNNWESSYQQARSLNTTEGNPRLDLVNFNYHHALSPLLDTRDLRMQIRLHKHVVDQQFGGAPADASRGYFPAETAFSTRMIPALKAEGIEWTLFDSIHLERAVQNYPHTNASNLFAPNRADQINPAIPDEQWVQLNNLWAPSKVAAPLAYRPHMAQYVDPNTGAIEKIVAVPAARYEGNEDGRGGFGALQYEQVFDQYRQFNTDPDHPMFVVLHHDGDNFGGGSESYYNGNFNNMVNWVSNNPHYNASTVQDYLDRFPVDPNSVVHIEPGSWAGADNGDAEFKKWLGDPDPNTGWSPDQNSWAVLTAAKNHVFTADDLQPVADLQNVIDNTGNGTERAWHYLLQAEASDHWYWDGTETWDSNVTLGSNLAIAQADQVLDANPGQDGTAPTVFLPQRESYNPGGYEWDPDPEPTDFEVWTFAYDVSGLDDVVLKWRVDLDGFNPLDSTDNETYIGGSEVGEWNSVVMNSSSLPMPPGDILDPTVRAERFSAMITGQEDVLLDYYIEAVDTRGNLTRTDIQHVYVGMGMTAPGADGFVMDGVLDEQAVLLAEVGGRSLWAALENGTLYLATDDAGEGMDAFIFLADELGGTVGSPWAKSGQVAGWDAFLADENDNDWSGWFDTAGSVLNATGANGGVLEGVIDLDGEFGSLPVDLYLASALYATADGGALVPAGVVGASSNGDLNLDAAEYLRLELAALIGSPEALGDLDGDGNADLGDLALFLAGAGTVIGDANLDQNVDTSDLAVLASSFGNAVDSYAEGDFNLDGFVNTSDLAILAAAFDMNPNLEAGSAAVPEPGTLAMLGLAVIVVVRRR